MNNSTHPPIDDHVRRSKENILRATSELLTKAGWAASASRKCLADPGLRRPPSIVTGQHEQIL
jgi:hypothetical protein